MQAKHFLLTTLRTGRLPDIQLKREKRITEALNFKSGTVEDPEPIYIDTLPNGMVAQFFKPGYEAGEANPNLNDMRPNIGDINIPYKFEDLWAFLSGISLVDFEKFKMVLTLVYRNAYFMDHVEIKPGQLRYKPKKVIFDFIEDFNHQVENICPLGLYGLLYYLDLLAWNEDVKYHVEKDANSIFKPTFRCPKKLPNGQKDTVFNTNVGRINTLKTCIRVPYQTSLFAKELIDDYNKDKKINFKKILTVMQDFSISGGVCLPSNQNLLDWLRPYLINDISSIDSFNDTNQ